MARADENEVSGALAGSGSGMERYDDENQAMSSRTTRVVRPRSPPHGAGAERGAVGEGASSGGGGGFFGLAGVAGLAPASDGGVPAPDWPGPDLAEAPGPDAADAAAEPAASVLPDLRLPNLRLPEGLADLRFPNLRLPDCLADPGLAGPG